MNGYKTKKELLCGVTYDEVFSTVNKLFFNVGNGLDIGETFYKLYNLAAISINENIKKESFFALLKGNFNNRILFANTYQEMFELAERIIKAGNERKENICYYKVTFDKDAFLEEILPCEESIFEKILKTVETYKSTNTEFLSKEEKASLEEQIITLKTLVSLLETDNKKDIRFVTNFFNTTI